MLKGKYILLCEFLWLKSFIVIGYQNNNQMKIMCCKPLAAKLISLDCLEQKGIFYLPPSISAIFQVTKKNTCQDSWINKQHETNKQKSTKEMCNN